MKETIKNLKRVYKYAREYRKNFIAFTVLSLILIGFNIVTPILSARIIVALTDNLYVELIMVAILLIFMNILGSIELGSCGYYRLLQALLQTKPI